MKVADLAPILSDLNPEDVVNVGLISQYPNTFNAERVLLGDGVVVIEADE